MARRKAYRFTQAARERFLARLAATVNVQEAVRAAEVNDSTAYYHRLRDPAFAHAWRMALLAGYDRIELALIRRALGLKDAPGGGDGDEETGELDVELALKLLTRHKPVVEQATTEAVAATFRASRDAAEAALLTKLRSHARRLGLPRPPAASELPVPDGEDATP